MKERLVIENFGPIKYVDLNLNKINIFIGPNASGKSTISKINAIVKSQAILHNLFKYRDKKKKEKVIDTLINFFNIKSFVNEKSILKYQTDEYKIFKTFYNEEIKSLKDVGIANVGNIDSLFNDAIKKSNFYKTLFIPTERLFYSTISSSLMGLINSDINLPKFFTQFGNNFEKARTEFNIYTIDFMGINYSFQNGLDLIFSKQNERILLSESASSIQSIVPMFLTVLSSSVNNKKNHFVIEEPELNLFPETQKGLVSFLTENTYKNNNSLTVNTHSPYILMALNNLIEADNVLKELKKGKTDNKILSERKEEIKKIVKSEQFVDFDDIAVYYIHSDGTAEDIKDYENRLINAEKIDSVSDIFADEVDALSDIKF